MKILEIIQNSEKEDSLFEITENMFNNQNQIIPKYKKENYNIKDINILKKSNILNNKSIIQIIMHQ